MIKSRGIAADNEEDIKEGYPALKANPKFGNLTRRELYKYLLKPENVAKAKTYATFYTYTSNMITTEGLKYLEGLTRHNSQYQMFVGAYQYIRNALDRRGPPVSGEFYKPHGGMSSIINGLYKNIKAFKGKIYTNAEVLSISKENHHYIIKTSNLKVRAKKLVVATPPKQFHKITGRIAKMIQKTAQFKSFVTIPAFKAASVYKTPWWENVKIGDTFVKADQYFVSTDDNLGGSLAYK